MVAILIMIQDKPNLEKVIEHDIWRSIKEFLELGIELGKGDKAIHLTIGLILLLAVALFLANISMKWMRSLITRKMSTDDKLKFASVFQFVKYMIYLVVVLLTMSAANVDITIMITASAALFVGLGLALQELFQDVIGGIMIILDKSLHVGDIVEVDGKVGRVMEIKLRTTRSLTRDDKVVIIPNHKFISDVIYNYTQNHRTTRECVKLGVAYGSDVQLVTKLLLSCLEDQKDILKSPKPFVLFEDFGDSALQFGVYYYTTNSYGDPRIKSDIRYRIDSLFRKNKISIPFPQRDIHFYPNPILPGNDQGN